MKILPHRLDTEPKETDSSELSRSRRIAGGISPSDFARPGPDTTSPQKSEELPPLVEDHKVYSSDDLYLEALALYDQGRYA